MARELGVSLRRLNGWEPAESTEFVYDVAGRLVRTVTTREPEWSRDEVALFVAARRVESAMGPYGVPVDRALAKNAKFAADPIPMQNAAVAAVERVRDAYFRQYPKASREGLLWRVHEVEPPE